MGCEKLFLKNSAHQVMEFHCLECKEVTPNILGETREFVVTSGQG